jgi:hypothetical protein
MYLYTGQSRNEIPRDITHLKIDSSVTEISEEAFRDCDRLIDVGFSEGLKTIGEFAFKGCRLLKILKLPSTVVAIRKYAFSFCYDLTSVEMCDGLERIEEGAFHHCVSLINIRIPKTGNEIHRHAFSFCAKLQLRCSEEDALIETLTKRFDNLPIHKLCYEHSYHPTAFIFEKLNTLMKDKESQEAAINRGQDCFGMTPLHILALSGNPNLDLFKVILKGSNNKMDIVTKDRHGSLPIHYACISKMPLEIFQLLLDTQRSAFPRQHFDWKTFVWIAPLIPAYRYVVHLSIERRIECLGLEEWRSNMLKTISCHFEFRHSHLRQVHSMLAKYERMESLSLLELALWQAKINELKETTGTGKSEVKERHLDPMKRWDCRINCGDEVIISHILPFLGRYSSSLRETNRQ